jgi:cytochrome c-type biogenesis protein
MVLGIPELAFIFSSGFFALLSPCGFPMLPGYVGYYLGTRSYPGRPMIEGTVCCFGLLLIFSLIGILASLFSGLVTAYLSFLELIAGVVTFFMGTVLLARLKLPIPACAHKAPKQQGFVGLFVFGCLYGLATVSCSAPIFLSILVVAISGGALKALTSFVVYALGMGLPLILITVILAVTKETVHEKVAELTSTIQRLAGLILMIVGGYLIYYFVI